MLKNICRLEHKINNREIHLSCDQDTPITDIKEALLEFIKFIGKIEDDIKSNQKNVPEVNSEEPKQEVTNGESSK